MGANPQRGLGAALNHTERLTFLFCTCFVHVSSSFNIFGSKVYVHPFLRVGSFSYAPGPL